MTYHRYTARNLFIHFTDAIFFLKPKGHLWLKKIRPNFKSLEKMNDDITALKNRQTTPTKNMERFKS